MLKWWGETHHESLFKLADQGSVYIRIDVGNVITFNAQNAAVILQISFISKEKQKRVKLLVKIISNNHSVALILYLKCW